MAEEERQWFQQHNHEINTVAYGSVGRATYDPEGKKWTFLRKLDDRFDNEENDTDDVTAPTCPLQLLSQDAEIVLEKSRRKFEDTVRSESTIKLIKRLPSLAAAATISDIATRENYHGNPSSITGQTIALGSAVQLNSDNSLSTNLTVPIMVTVVGEDTSVLRLTPMSQSVQDYRATDGFPSKVTIPSLHNANASIWSSTEPILQILFAGQNQGVHNDVLLAVRQASRITLFQPSLSRTSSTAAEEVPLQSNKLMTIASDATGGYDHADVAFKPHSHTDLAIVDVEGNWSTWKIHIRRQNIARILHTAQMIASGKVFSWTNKKRPNGVGLYLDGWHRVIWLSSDASEVDHVLVCNRQTVKLFDLCGNKVSSIDPRLDTKKVSSYIVDIKAGPTTSTFFMLTTTKLLLFDIAQSEWRDLGRSKGPALLCTWDHYHNSTDLSLRVSYLHLGHEGLIVLSSDRSSHIRIYSMRTQETDERTSVVSSMSTLLMLPRKDDNKIKNILFHLVEARIRHDLSTRFPRFVHITTQYEDLSISSILATWHTTGYFGKTSEETGKSIRLPPIQSSRVKSDKWVTNEEDEDSQDDSADFIVSDLLMAPASHPLHTSNISLYDNRVKQSGSSKQMAQIANHFVEEQYAAAPSTKLSLPEAFQRLSEALTNIEEPESRLLSHNVSELFAELPRIDDAEDDSMVVESLLEDLAQEFSKSLDFVSVCTKPVPPLSKIYEQLFEKYISSLPATMSNRSRIQREWIIREVAMDLQLSRRVIRLKNPEDVRDEDSKPASRSQPTVSDPQVFSSDAIIFSDPLQPTEDHSNHLTVPSIAQISASQPQTTTSIPENTAAKPRPESSHLSSAVSRLSRLTTFQPLSLTDIPDSINDHVAGLLAHLPESTDSDPSYYNWATAEFDIATTRAAQDPSLNPSDPKAKRKVERLAKARRRAEQIRKEVERDQERRSVVPMIINTQSQHLPDLVNDLDVRSVTAGSDLGSLPFRGPSARSPRSQLPSLPNIQVSSPLQPSRNGWSQPQGMAESSASQGQIRHGIASTQPEGGVFGGRNGTAGARDRSRDKDGRKRKKVKPLPGFG